ncbi:Histone-lysine N-methyltransferase ATXR6 [Capsicum annuum]|nr:Histone-lysine N-methyltransferase ATXR6 [Capsicum annuum]
MIALIFTEFPTNDTTVLINSDFLLNYFLMMVLCKDDIETLDLCKNMMKQGEWPQLMVVFYPKERFTVEADVFIRNWIIITEYVGDVDYLNNREADDGDSMMTLLSTNDTSKDLVICPDKRNNIARFINNKHLKSGSTWYLHNTNNILSITNDAQ